MTREDLKPCPFCGVADPLIVPTKYLGGRQDWHIECIEGVGVGCGVKIGPYATEAEARARWNTRAQPRALPGEGEGGALHYGPAAVDAVQRLLERGKAFIDPDGYLRLATQEGFVLVPKEPTPEMVKAGNRAWVNDAPDEPPMEYVATIYRAMLAAAAQTKTLDNPINTL
jgi:hypothetical protein